MTLLAVFTCKTCSSALLRHWPYFLRQKADLSFVIRTTDKGCVVPDGVSSVVVGVDQYIQGSHLPERLINAIAAFLGCDWDTIILAEYDTLIFKRMPVENLKDAASHIAGRFKKEYGFYHNPWVMTREVAEKFVAEGDKAVHEGICNDPHPENSPDVFFGAVMHRLGIPVQTDLWREFSRNSLDSQWLLEEARNSYRDGVSVIHGIKHAHELEYIQS